MTAHFGGDGLLTSEEQRHVGCVSSPKSVPTHITLRPDEGIQLLALRIPDKQECPQFAGCGPSLIIKTNNAQRVLCGPYGPLKDRNTKSIVLYVSMPEKRKDMPVLGLFVDMAMAMSTSTGDILQSFGVCIEKSPPPPPNAKKPFFTVPIPRAPTRTEMGYKAGERKAQVGPKEAALFSLALVAGKSVQTVHLRRRTTVDRRVLGFCIRYANGSFQTLGAWMPDTVNAMTTTTRIDTLYDASKDDKETAGILPSLSFLFSDDGTYVKDIVMGNVDVTKEHDLVLPVARHGFRNLAWRCTATNDAIHPPGPVSAYVNFIDQPSEGIVRDDDNPQWVKRQVDVGFC